MKLCRILYNYSHGVCFEDIIEIQKHTRSFVYNIWKISFRFEKKWNIDRIDKNYKKIIIVREDFLFLYIFFLLE